MDELLSDFLTETTEHIEGAENQLIDFERDPTNEDLLASIFRLLHTIKGTASFLGLERLPEIAHLAETVISELRDGVPPTDKTVSVVLVAIDRIKQILAEVSELGSEPPGDDEDVKQLLRDNLPSNANKAGSAEPAAEAETVAEADGQATAEAASSVTEEAAAPQAAATEPKPEAPKAQPAAAKKPAPPRSAKSENDGAKAQESIRVTVDTIEQIMQLVSELVLTRNQLLELTRQKEEDGLKGPMQRLSALTTDLQDAVMRARMQPVGRLYANLPRLIRELASELGKKIDLVTAGADTELDRQLIEVMRDPLTHLIRNCADHGLETPEERIEAGKPEAGQIRVSAAHEAGQITIAIEDDGRGLNIEKLKEKAQTKGLMSEGELEQASEQDICQLIFEPGFSTAKEVTSVSGRGVGMDVVRSNLEAIGGSVSLKSKQGAGCTFSLKIPLTLAIAPALIVVVGDQRYALPQHAVVEAVGLGSQSRHRIERLQNALVLKLREEVIPVVDLKGILHLGEAIDEENINREDQLVVIMRVGVQTFGVIVDAVADVQEIVVKPMSSTLAHLKTFTGHTILGDGSVVLILDPAGAAQLLGIEKIDDKKREAGRNGDARTDKRRYVAFHAGAGAPKVIPLSLISRIEMVPASSIEVVNGRYVLQRENGLMPIVQVGGAMGWEEDQNYPVLIVASGGQTMGLLVDEIADIFEEDLKFALEENSSEVIGTAVYNDKAVELLDIVYYMQQAYPEPRSRPVSTSRPVVVLSDDRYVSGVLCPMLTSAGFNVFAVETMQQVEDVVEREKRVAAFVIDEVWQPADGGRLEDELVRLKKSHSSALVLLSSELDQLIAPAELDGSAISHVLKHDRLALLDQLISMTAGLDDAADNDEGVAA
ncbi:MAG: chemotaxis protein CheA [Filomicrobium sp.]